MTSKEIQDKVYERAEKIQSELHKFIEEMTKRNKNLDRETCETVFFLTKVAELQLGIEALIDLTKSR
jgi:hypothetical protein